MSDYSNNYINNKYANIYFAYKFQVLKFKPFIEGFSSIKSAKTTPFKTFYNEMPSITAIEQSFKLKLNIPSDSYNESLLNHKKFQRLIRMLFPLATSAIQDDNFSTNKTQMYVKFSNLIGDSSAPEKNNYTYKEITERGELCSLKSFSYKPDLDMGFYENQGIILAKSFTLDLDLKLERPANNKISKDSLILKQLDDEDTSQYNPGNRYGFPTPLDINK